MLQDNQLRGSMQLTPAEYVISVFKGVRATARAIGRSPSSVCKWRRDKDRAGTDGQIPRCAQVALLLKAREMGLDLTAEDLIFGRAVGAPSEVVHEQA